MIFGFTNLKPQKNITKIVYSKIPLNLSLLSR